jgi:hypothetical protein
MSVGQMVFDDMTWSSSIDIINLLSGIDNKTKGRLWDTTFGAKTLSITAFSMMTFSIMTFSFRDLYVILSIIDSQHK